MTRWRRQKQKQSHYCLLVNKKATNYNQSLVNKLAYAIRSKGGYYSIFSPDSSGLLYQTAMKTSGLKRWYHPAPQSFSKRGKVTAFIACGGDGTFNIVAQVALKANLPVGILPMGKFNNIALSLYGSDNADTAINRMMERSYRKIDTATIAGKTFFSSVGFGFVPQMAATLNSKKKPRFSMGWAKLGQKSAQAVTTQKTVIKIDSFRFEINPTIFNVNLLPYTLGLPFSTVSLYDDSQAEIIFDVGVDSKVFSTFTRQIYKKKYIYGSDIKLFRGKDITAQFVKEAMIYLDGELIKLNDDFVKIEIGNNQLKVFC
ncbi:MAG: hypothetical protein GXO93_03730 [FCB group bacterium]|nr:hypothetical protein [FCB group bacterium]